MARDHACSQIDRNTTMVCKAKNQNIPYGAIAFATDTLWI